MKNESELLKKVMDFLASMSELEEDNVMPRYYVDVLCLQLVLLDSKGIVAEHVLSFVVALRMFLAYEMMNNLCLFPVYEHGDNIDKYTSLKRLFVSRCMDTRQVRKLYPHLITKSSQIFGGPKAS